MRSEKSGLRVAGYARISYSEDSNKESDSIVNQKSMIRDYAREHFEADLAESDFFVDDNYSGTSFTRPGLLTLLDKANAHAYDVIIAKDLSRLGRHNARTLLMLEDLQKADVQVITISDNMDSANPDNDALIGIKTWYNELYVKDISRKIRSTIKNKQKNGTWICTVPYGYTMIDAKKGIFEVDEVAAITVREIFKLYVGGWGYKRISNYLTDKGIPTPNMHQKAAFEREGRSFKKKCRPEWSIPTVSEILTNDFYIGTLRTGKYARKSINGTDVRTEEEAQNVFPNFHEAIVDADVFKHAQEAHKRRNESQYTVTRKYDNPYSGLLFCGDCGSPMFSVNVKNRPPCYYCGTYYRRGLKGCSSHHTHRSTLNAVLFSYIEQLAANASSIIDKLNKNLQDAMKNKRDTDNTVLLLEKELGNR